MKENHGNLKSNMFTALIFEFRYEVRNDSRLVFRETFFRVSCNFRKFRSNLGKKERNF